MNDIDDARQEICLAIYLVGAGLADSPYVTVVFATLALLYFLAIFNAARNKK